MVVGTNMVIVERDGYRFKVPKAEVDAYLERYEGATVVEGATEEKPKTQSKRSKSKAESDDKETS